MAGSISMSIGAGRITVSCVAGAIPGAVGGWNRRTSAFVTYGSNARVLGGTRSTAIRCWRFAVRSTMGHWIRWLCGINSGHEACKNYLMFPSTFELAPVHSSGTTPFSQQPVVLTKQAYIELTWEANYWRAQH